jgi:uncharacterized protein (DUF58 family)
MTATTSRPPSQARIALRELTRAMASAAARVAAWASPAGRAFTRVAVPVLRTVTPLGWLVAGGALVSFLVAAILGWAEFLFVGATLTAAFLIALCFVFGRSSYAVGIDLNPRRVTAGGRAMGRVTVRNAGRRPVLPTRMEVPVGAGTAEFLVPRLTPEAEDEEHFAVPTERRALILAGPAISVRGDQLGLLRRTTRWSDQVELFVHPRTTRLVATARGLVRDLEGQPTKAITNSDLAFHALRPYEPGDDIRNVHWRTSARTGQLMVRQYQETRRSQLLLLLSAERSHFASDDEFELAVSVTASIGVQVIREETQLNVVWERERLRHRTPTTLLDDSCRIEPVDGIHPTLRDFARAAGARLVAPSLVIAVVGSGVELHELRSMSTLYPVDTVVLGVRAIEGADSTISKVGSMTVLTVGRLEDLPALLQRSGR